jgi:hypothetical protein
MLSFKEGRPIAIIKGGKYNNQILHITENNENNMIKNSPLEMLEDIYKGKNKKKLSRTEMTAIKNALITGDEEKAESLYEIISDVRQKSKEMSKKEFKIYDEGIIQPLPRFNKTERCYIAGQTECGKTYWCKKYLEQMRKVHPKKKIFVFSDVAHDPELDSIKNLIRFELDEELIDKKPIKPEVFKDSICVFDDIGSIQDKQLYKIIQNLRDSLLRRGRHEDISTLITSHLLTNYKDTRIILNECNSITIFCRSGSTYGIKYLLKKYIGLDKKGIQKVLNLPSRWITIYKNHPQYILYEKGVYIL